MHVVPLRAAADVVLYTSGAAKAGNWASVADSTAAGGSRITSADNGWSSTDGALASPGNYFELSFPAEANTAYHVWVRLKAGWNSKSNDSVYLQWNDSVDGNGSALYRIGTTSSLTVNLQTCNGCALSGWGWVDGAYWLSQATTDQVREQRRAHDSVPDARGWRARYDQIVLGAASYLNSAPGQSSVIRRSFADYRGQRPVGARRRPRSAAPRPPFRELSPPPITTAAAKGRRTATPGRR